MSEPELGFRGIAPVKKYTPTVKAYRNTDFLNSSQARLVRIMCEYEETMLRMKRHKIKATILIFGSARSKTREEFATAKLTLDNLIADAREHKDKTKLAELNSKMESLDKTKWMTEMTDKVETLGRLLTEW